MLEFTYHLDLLTNSYQFGLQTHERLYILKKKKKLTSNPDLLNLICNIPSFSICVDSGKATARRENGYWYVYKKITGILNKEYLGLVEDITEVLMTETVRKVNIQKKKIKRNILINDHVNTEPPSMYMRSPPELAGHKKNANHFQTSLIPANQEISMLKQEVDSLQATLAMGKTDYMILHEEIRAVQRDRLAIIAERDDALNHLKDKKVEPLTKSKSVQWLEKELLRKHNEHIKQIEEYKTFERLTKEITADKNESILQLLSDKDKNELKLINLACKLKEADNINLILEKYRNFAKDKNKQSHPRYSYLIDFLAEIDK